MQGIASNPQRKGKVVNQFINVALVLKEVGVLIVDVPGAASGCFCQLDRFHVPLADKTARYQCSTGQLHDSHHPGCKGGAVRKVPSNARDKTN